MKTVSIQEMREFEHHAIEDLGIPGIVLMENAGLRAADHMHEWYERSLRHSFVLIVCGTGNNGGDGCVVARHLINRGYAVDVQVVGKRGALKGDAYTNARILEEMHASLTYTEGASPNLVFREKATRCDFVVDALFGIGLERDLKEPYSEYVSIINSSKRPVVALDIPSGLHGDTGVVMGCAVKATKTITFEYAKKGLYLASGPEYTGEVVVVDIGVAKAKG